jgi:hypothetical protein
MCIPALGNGLCTPSGPTVRLSLPDDLPLIRRSNAVYQPFMLLALKKWFPDFESQVLALGGMIKPYDISLCFSGLVFGSPTYIQPKAQCLPKHANIPMDGQVPHSFYLRRVLFEPLLRKLVKRWYPHVRFMRGTVTGIVLDTEKRRVVQVEYTGESGERANFGCALFVDCTGMARMGVKWLQKAGLPTPKVVTYNARLRYGFSEYFGFISGSLLIVRAVHLPIPPSVKDRLPIPGGVHDCQPMFYANVSQSVFDWRTIYAKKIEGDKGEPCGWI